MGLNQKKTVMRLDKYLADMGIGTRSQVKEKNSPGPCVGQWKNCVRSSV